MNTNEKPALRGKWRNRLMAGTLALTLSGWAYAQATPAVGADAPKSATTKPKHGGPADGKHDKHRPQDGSGAPDGPGANRSGPHGPGADALPPGARRRGLPHKKVDRAEALEAYRTAVKDLQTAQMAAKSDQKEQSQEAMRERMQAMRAVQAANRDLKIAYRKSARELLTLPAAQQKEIQEKLKARDLARRSDRKARTDARRSELKKELGPKADLVPVRGELTRHAWRVARLERLIDIAEAASRAPDAARARALLAKEMELHPKRLAEASSGKPTPAAPVTSDKRPASPKLAVPKKEVGAP